MLRVGVGYSVETSTARAVEQAAASAMDQLGGGADTALVFATIEHWSNRAELVGCLQARTQTEAIVGCSGTGVLTGDAEIDAGPGIAIMVLASDRVKAEPLLYHPLRDRDRQFGEWLAQKVGLQPDSGALAALFPDTYNTQPPVLLQGLEEHLPSLTVVGAGCSESGAGRETYQLCGPEITTNAVAGIAITGAYAASIGITQGCQPVTEPVTVTKAEGNLIFQIDHRPAFEVFARILGAPLLENLRRALAYVFVGVPADRERNRVEPGEYLVRNIIGVDPKEGILAVGDEVREGERIVFTLRDGQRAREDLTQMLKRQAAQLEGRRPDFGLYFDCCARGSSLYGMPGIDTAYIRNILGAFPLIGFFGNFELGPVGAKNHLLAYTGVLVLINEI